MMRVLAFIRDARGWRRAGLAIAAGAISALALAPFYALPLMALGFSTLVLLIDASALARRPWRAAFSAGWFFGFGYFLVGVYWMAFSFFVQADQFAWMAPFAIMGMPAFLALFTGMAALCAARAWAQGPARIVIFAVAWTALEYLRGHILTGLPWNLAGQALAGTAVGAQSAAWYGAYGLSFVTVLLAAAPAAGVCASLRPRALIAGVAASVVGVAFLFALGAARLAWPLSDDAGSPAALRIVQPNIAQREKIDPDFWVRNFMRQLDLSTGPAPADVAAALADGAPLFIIWPENAAPLLDEASTALSWLDERLAPGSVLIAGAVRRAPGADSELAYYNSVVIIPDTNEGRRVGAYYDKHHLVPFGEYLPFYKVLKAIGLAQLTPYGDAGFAAGAGPETIAAGGRAFAPLICYEAIFPGRVHPRTARPDWIVAVTNDAWFGDTSGPRQHLDQARLRSIETGLPMARAANTGVSAVIDGKGRILQRIPLYEQGRIDAISPPRLRPPLYTRWGDAIFVVMLTVALAFIWRPSATKIARFG